MARFSLVEISQDGAYNRYRGCNEDSFRYRDETGREVKFHAHPTREFNYVVMQGDRTLASRVIDAYLDAAMIANGDNHREAYNAAIQTLEVR